MATTIRSSISYSFLYAKTPKTKYDETLLKHLI